MTVPGWLTRSTASATQSNGAAPVLLDTFVCRVPSYRYSRCLWVSGEEHHMARIPGVPARQAGPYVKLAYYFTRRSLRRLTGRAPERMLEPLEMYAYVPGLLRGYAGLEQARRSCIASTSASGPW